MASIAMKQPISKQQEVLPLYVIQLDGCLTDSEFGFLKPIKEGFAAIDFLLSGEDKEILLYIPDIQYKKMIEDWLIATHHPMLFHLVSEFVTVSDRIPRTFEKFIGPDAMYFHSWGRTLTVITWMPS